MAKKSDLSKKLRKRVCLRFFTYIKNPIITKSFKSAAATNQTGCSHQHTGNMLITFTSILHANHITNTIRF